MQQDQYNQTRTDLQPFTQAGQSASNQLTQQLPGLTAPINMDQATLQQTPGYQFALRQGLKAVSNSAGARGLGGSGAALRGAADYTTGLADQTYQQQFNNALSNKQFAYNSLLGTSQLGAGAAGQAGQIGQQGAANAGQSLTSAGTALAGGITGASNALLTGANNYGGYQLAQQQLAQQQAQTAALNKLSGLYG